MQGRIRVGRESTDYRERVTVTPEPIFDAGDEDFEQRVLERSRTTPVIVDFQADWCGPCRVLGPLLERVVRESDGRVELARVDVDRAPALATARRVTSIPLVIGFRDGKAIAEFTGVRTETEIREFVEGLLPTEGDLLVRDAAAVEETDPARAAQLYRDALAAQEGHPRALIGLARVLLARGENDEAGEILERMWPGGDERDEVERLQGVLFVRRKASLFDDEASIRARVAENPSDPERRYELGCVLAAAGRYRESLEELLAAVELDRQFAREKVREAMVKIFAIVGHRDELAEEFRGKLTRVLY